MWSSILKVLSIANKLLTASHSEFFLLKDNNVTQCKSFTLISGFFCVCCMWCTFFFQVPVAYGQRFEHGKVAETCENAGMKALCWGDDSCSYTKNANSRQVSNESDSTLIMPIRCVVTPYNLGCGTTGSRNTLTKVPNSSSIWGLSSKLKVSKFHSKLRPISGMMYSFKALCGVTDPKKCPDLWGVFSYMPKRSSGECGTLNGTWCLDGKNTIATPGQNTYYALCASAIGEHFYLANALYDHTICRNNYPSSFRCWKQHLQGIWWYPVLHCCLICVHELLSSNPEWLLWHCGVCSFVPWVVILLYYCFTVVAVRNLKKKKKVGVLSIAGPWAMDTWRKLRTQFTKPNFISPG